MSGDPWEEQSLKVKQLFQMEQQARPDCFSVLVPYIIFFEGEKNNLNFSVLNNAYS